jgi:hypothetical protein
MPRINVRVTESLLAAAKTLGDGDASLGARRAIVRAAGLPAEEAEPPAPNFADATVAKKASRKGVRARCGVKR